MKTKPNRFFIYCYAFAVASVGEVKFTLELARESEDRNEKLFHLLFNMIQFTLSTVLYLSINLFKESLACSI